MSPDYKEFLWPARTTRLPRSAWCAPARAGPEALGLRRRHPGPAAGLESSGRGPRRGGLGRDAGAEPTKEVSPARPGKGSSVRRGAFEMHTPIRSSTIKPSPVYADCSVTDRCNSPRSCAGACSAITGLCRGGFRGPSPAAVFDRDSSPGGERNALRASRIRPI